MLPSLSMAIVDKKSLHNAKDKLRAEGAVLAHVVFPQEP
jgi:hypothetical protein